MQAVADSVRNSTYLILEGGSESRPCRTTQSFIITLIILNGIAVILESNKDIHASYASLF